MRAYYRDRFDHRSNVVDWDHSMKIQNNLGACVAVLLYGVPVDGFNIHCSCCDVFVGLSSIRFSFDSGARRASHSRCVTNVHAAEPHLTRTRDANAEAPSNEVCVRVVGISRVLLLCCA